MHGDGGGGITCVDTVTVDTVTAATGDDILDSQDTDSDTVTSDHDNTAAIPSDISTTKISMSSLCL